MKIDAVAHLVGAGRLAPSADNTQPWEFAWDGESLKLRFATKRVSGHLFGARDLATELSLGAVQENLHRAASAAGQTLEMLPSDAGGCSARVTAGPAGACTALPPELGDRHTNRWPFFPRPLPDPLVDRVAGMTQGAARVVVHTDRRETRALARAVDLASRARFRTRELHLWLAQSLRFGAGADDAEGLAVETLPLPPGGAALLRWLSPWRRMRWLNRLGLFRALALKERAPVAGAPALISIAAPRGSAVDAGRLMQRVWLELTRQRVAVHPYYVIADQLDRRERGRVAEPLRSTVDELARLVETIYGRTEEGGAEPRMLLRVGYPRRATVPRSGRLPLSRLCLWLAA